MGVRRKPVDLDEALIERARDAAGAPEKSDSEVVEQALVVYLGMRALDQSHQLGGLDEDEANRVAAEEVRAVRRARDPSA